MADFGIDDLILDPFTAGGYTAVKQGADLISGGEDPIGGAASDVGDFITGGVDDFSNVGQVTSVGGRYQATPYDIPAMYYGGYAGGAQSMAGHGLNNMNTAMGQSNAAFDTMLGAGAGQGIEDQELSNREAYSRGYDQSGALQLMREAAMGQAPSQAAWQMQEGLDRAQANQAGLAGGARGAGALGVAQANAAANSANLQQQAYTNAAQLRAQEMAQARGAYGGLSTDVRGQDLNRLNMGNEMAQGNANLYNQYNLGVGNVGAAYGNMGLGYYGQAQKPFESELNAGVAASGQRANSWDSAQRTTADSYNQQQDRALRADIATSAAKQAQVGKVYDTISGLVSTAGTAAAGGKAPAAGGAR